eukprot:9068695-Pyramimonas_sp.AAC.1
MNTEYDILLRWAMALTVLRSRDLVQRVRITNLVVGASQVASAPLGPKVTLWKRPNDHAWPANAANPTVARSAKNCSSE